MDPVTSAHKALEALRNRIPAFSCKPGCTDCCGPAPWMPVELEGLGDKLRREIESQDLGDLLKRANAGDVCPFAVPGEGCRVYEQRPVMCRLYGAVEDLRCPNGYRPEQLLTSREARGIIRTYANLIQGG